MAISLKMPVPSRKEVFIAKITDTALKQNTQMMDLETSS